MSIMDNITAHYDANSAREYEVPEWGATFYLSPITAMQLGNLGAKIQKGDMDAIIDLVIKCVKDENNAPAFTLKDKPVLKRKADFTILSRIVGEIMDVPEVEELEKN